MLDYKPAQETFKCISAEEKVLGAIHLRRTQDLSTGEMDLEVRIPDTTGNASVWILRFMCYPMDTHRPSDLCTSSSSVGNICFNALYDNGWRATVC